MYINPDDAQDVTTVSALTRQEAIYAGQRMSATEAGFLVQAYYQFQDQRLRANNQVRELEAKLVEAQEQISELKMLVAIYEEKLAQSDH